MGICGSKALKEKEKMGSPPVVHTIPSENSAFIRVLKRQNARKNLFIDIAPEGSGEEKVT